MKYQIKEKFFSLTNNFVIYNEAGANAYEIKGKLLSFSSRQTLLNQQGQALLTIKTKYLSWRPACRLILQNNTEWLIKKCLWPLWRSRFRIDTPHGKLEITGDIWEHEYQVKQGSELLASISKKWFSWTDTYGVEIHAKHLTAELLASVIVIDRLSHQKTNSTSDH